MDSKEWFALLRYPVPADLEFFLEEKASEGYFLKNLGQMGFFYYEFCEAKSAKCKYMVDLSRLPRALYVETLVNQGWEYLGSSGNCYIWRKTYEDKRPDDMSDHICLKKHCRNMGILSVIASLILLVLTVALVIIFGIEIKNNVENIHTIYLAEAVIHIPIIIYLFNCYKKFMAGMARYI